MRGGISSQKDLDNLEDVILAKVNPFRYAGYRYDEETKLYYLMARYYNPDTGVFLSLDPVRGDTMNPIPMNVYNYANSNPVMNVDPDGTKVVKYYVTRTTYALFTGLACLFLSVIGGLTRVSAIMNFWDMVKNYK